MQPSEVSFEFWLIRSNGFQHTNIGESAPVMGGWIMTDFKYGLMLLCVGMGGTVFALGLIIGAIQLLQRMLPYSEAEEKRGKEKL